jgi:hypothetical protein
MFRTFKRLATYSESGVLHKRRCLPAKPCQPPGNRITSKKHNHHRGTPGILKLTKSDDHKQEIHVSYTKIYDFFWGTINFHFPKGSITFQKGKFMGIATERFVFVWLAFGGGEGSRTPVRNRIHQCFYGCRLYFGVSLRRTSTIKVPLSVAFKSGSAQGYH